MKTLNHKEAMEVSLAVLRKCNVCENARSRYFLDLKMCFNEMQEVPLDRIENMLISAIHASLCTSIEINRVLNETYNKLIIGE